MGVDGGSLGVVEVAGGEDEEFFVGDGVGDGELAGGRDGGVEEGGGAEGGGLDVSCGDGGVVEGEGGLGDLGVVFVIDADGFAGALALHGEAEGVVSEAGDGEEGFAEACFPGEGECADAATEGLAAEEEVAGGVRCDFKDGGGGGPEVCDAEAMEVGFGGVDAVDDMAWGAGREVCPCGFMEAAGAGEDAGGGCVGGFEECRSVAATVAVADDKGAGEGLFGDGDPCADTETAQAVELGIEDVVVIAFEGGAGFKGEIQGDGASLCVGVAPEVLETGDFGRWVDGEELGLGIAVGGIEGEIMLEHVDSGLGLSERRRICYVILLMGW